ncbi:cytochrome c oxidase subunit II [Methylocystis bryophila]|uniref:cytochrome-c oxidase n=2 Tax=Methylocystis bryophila TaxID=655015 RepID=A0A1W6N082_9HYPH|nr:cytochrome c oxidase subunit II [Methylocystis bryophila]ARN83238.1 cytochrome c oxidase subunit II [Methylocystis bryophila]
MTEGFAPKASEYAGQWDGFFFALVMISAIVVVGIFAVIVGFSFHFRKGSDAVRDPLPERFRDEIEIGWTTATAFAFLFIFWFAASTQLHHIVPPRKAFEIHVLAKQWMWKSQHPNGVREINELHVPIGQPVQLIMTSEDVIHSLFLPALRLKQDVLPGRYTYLWFTADKPGVYHLMCAEYCGTGHSRMVGRLVLMTPEDYSRWSSSQPGAEDLAKEGELLFSSLGCSGCHAQTSSVHAPNLRGVYSHPVQLSDGRVVTADEAYLRDSILLPDKDVVAGYEPIMPSFRGIASEAQIIKLIAFIKSLSGEEQSE